MGDDGVTGRDGEIPDSYTRKTEVTVTHHEKTMVTVRSVLEDPDHYMEVVMEVGVPDRVIRTCTMRLDKVPFPACRRALVRGGELVGMRIEKGFARRAASIVGGHLGCAHLMEALMAAARLASSAVTAVAAGGTNWDTMYHEDADFQATMSEFLKDTCVVFSEPPRES